MAVEKRLVDADVFERDDPLILVDLEDSIDQEKRVPMRKNPHDLGDSKFVHYFLVGSALGAVAGAAAGALGAAVSMRRMISVVMSAMSSR